MKALILAAGFGTRLRPLTHKTPKALVPVNNIPMLLYTLAFIKHHGIRDVVINLHHLGHHIPKFLGNGKSIGLNISYSHEPQILGTGGGIKKALRFFKKDFLVINGDVVADFNLTALIKQHKKNKPAATFGLYQHPKKKKYGLLFYKGANLNSILGNPTPKIKSSSAMYAGFHCISKEQIQPDLKPFKPKTLFCIMRDVYIPKIIEGKDFGAYEIKGYWSVCDCIADIKRTERDLKKRRLSYQKELNKISSLLLP